jgi:hypothetical protein
MSLPILARGSSPTRRYTHPSVRQTLAHTESRRRCRTIGEIPLGNTAGKSFQREIEPHHGPCLPSLAASLLESALASAIAYGLQSGLPSAWGTYSRVPFGVYDRNSWHRARPAVASCRVLSSCLVVQKVFASHVHGGRRQSRNREPSALADRVESTPPPHKDTCTLLTIWSSSPHLARGAPISVGVSALENSFPDLLAQ